MTTFNALVAAPVSAAMFAPVARVVACAFKANVSFGPCFCSLCNGPAHLADAASAVVGGVARLATVVHAFGVRAVLGVAAFNARSAGCVECRVRGRCVGWKAMGSGRCATVAGGGITRHTGVGQTHRKKRI